MRVASGTGNPGLSSNKCRLFIVVHFRRAILFKLTIWLLFIIFFEKRYILQKYKYHETFILDLNNRYLYPTRLFALLSDHVLSTRDPNSNKIINPHGRAFGPLFTRNNNYKE